MIFQGQGVCKDCGEPFAWLQSWMGSPRQVCDACRHAKKRAKERPKEARKRQRRKEQYAGMDDRIKAIVERARDKEQES